MNDIKKTQHYSVNNKLIDGLSAAIPKNAYIIEPFYGNGDLVKTFNVSEFYDIDREDEHKRDTLLSPPDYKNKWVITNPPYLAKNKAKDKTLFNKYPYDDLYKIAISTMIEAEGGILVLPINFLTDERSWKIRQLFLDKFTILRLNIYLNGMFSTTDYNVCSFSFKKSEKSVDKQEIDTYIYSEMETPKNKTTILEKKYNYRFGGEFFDKLEKQENYFSRYTEKTSSEMFVTNIELMAIDKTDERICFRLTDKPAIGKESDRNLATLTCVKQLTFSQQNDIINTSNEILNNFRKETDNLCLTNYRDRGRKRIGFSDAYKIISLAAKELLII